jgi:hypothetical protein
MDGVMRLIEVLGCELWWAEFQWNSVTVKVVWQMASIAAKNGVNPPERWIAFHE